MKKVKDAFGDRKQKTRNRANVIDAIASKCVLFQ